ncbi:MAG: thermonuclease family protein [Pseudomonadota bacterium]
MNYFKQVRSIILVSLFVLVSISNLFSQAYIEAKVINIDDGDTITVRFDFEGKEYVEDIRMVGMDTPELHYIPNRDEEGNGKEVEPQPYAYEATQELKKLIPLGTNIILELKGEDPEGSRGFYKRILAYIYLADPDQEQNLRDQGIITQDTDLNINVLMVKLGWATPFVLNPGAPEEWRHVREFSEAAKIAKEYGLGIWNEIEPLEIYPYEFRRFTKYGGKKNWCYFVGDLRTGMAYPKEEYINYSRQEIPPEYRVFFYSLDDIKKSKFTFSPRLCTEGYFTADLLRVIDGDSVEIVVHGNPGLKESIRLANTDTQETKFWGMSQGIIAEKGAELLASMLNGVNEVTIVLPYNTIAESRDRYGRILGYVFADNVDINLEMIKTGYSLLYLHYPEIKFFNEYVDAAEQAYADKKGAYAYYEPEKILENYQAGNLEKIMPYEFRALERIKRGHTDEYPYYVGDLDTLKAYAPKYYFEFVASTVIPPHRVFFSSKAEVQEAEFELIE